MLFKNMSVYTQNTQQYQVWLFDYLSELNIWKNCIPGVFYFSRVWFWLRVNITHVHHHLCFPLCFMHLCISNIYRTAWITGCTQYGFTGNMWLFLTLMYLTRPEENCLWNRYWLYYIPWSFRVEYWWSMNYYNKLTLSFFYLLHTVLKSLSSLSR